MTTESTLPPGASRRAFLSRLGLSSAGALLAGAPVLASASSEKPVYRTSKDATGDLTFISATKAAELIRNKKVSSEELVKACYARIDAVNTQLNAVVQFCRERALAEARAADKALAEGKSLGPLHGVPMTIKDSIDTEGVITTGGTQGRAFFVPPADATAVARLRKAGAILLGKTNTPELTLGGVSGLGTTVNIVYGMSRNPYDNRRSTAGSSGGAGAIVAAGGAYFDIGSDFGGSIRGPAHANGIAGLKPTTGMIPRTGHIVDYGGIFDNYQQLGPMARRVEDLTLLLEIIAGPDAKDAAIVPMPWKDPAKVDLKKLRVAFYLHQGKDHEGRTAARPTADTEAMVRKCAAWLAELGCPVEESMPPGLLQAVELSRKLREGDGNAWQKRVLDRNGTTVPGPNRRFDFPLISSAEYTKLLEERDAWRTQMLQWVQKYDLILTPTTIEEAPLIGRPEARPPLVGTSFTSPYNIVGGWPAGVVRCGTTTESGMPLGIHVVAPPWKDEVVLAAMGYLESKSGGFSPPA